MQYTWYALRTAADRPCIALHTKPYDNAPSSLDMNKPSSSRWNDKRGHGKPRNHCSSSCCTGLYLPLCDSPSSPVRLNMLEIQPPNPSLCSDGIGRPFFTCTGGGSMSRPGMAWSAFKPCCRMSNDGTGERWPLKSDSASAMVAGLGITDVASPKIEFISSRRTFAVSG